MAPPAWPPRFSITGAAILSLAIGCGRQSSTTDAKESLARTGAKVVTLMADSGLKYLSTDVYRRR